MIIGVCGLIGAGKDTIADYLVNIHEFRRQIDLLWDTLEHLGIKELK